MKTKTFIIAGICGGIVNWLLSWLSYGIVLADYYPLPQENLRSFTYVFLGCLSIAFFLSYFFNRWAQIATITTGARAGAFFGFFLSISYGFIAMAMDSSMSAELLTLDVATSIVITGITGAVIGFINKKVR
ncbi:hypothetical protein [uncultured Winogradskyella sp.]|uniref:hypothetical protein n=1 Tax=Winogradskyella sp. 4-2091 TaxID=3381659 RepID=UPI002628A656|nr:hypothetical protein [uncultured Winogradskyella sp.]